MKIQCMPKIEGRGFPGPSPLEKKNEMINEKIGRFPWDGDMKESIGIQWAT